MNTKRLKELQAAIAQDFALNGVPGHGANVWREDPLPLIDFIRSPDHLSSEGALDLFPEQRMDLESFLSPAQDMPPFVDKRSWLAGENYDSFPGTDPKLLFDENAQPRYNQAFLLHGKGAGKDTITSFLHCWIAHILLCLNNPQEYLGLPPGESIDIPVIGYSENQAKTVYFEKFKTRIKSWPWLRRTIKELTGIDGDRYLRESGDYVHTYDVVLPHNIKCWSLNSSLGSSEGKNVLFWVLDELAAFTSPVKANLAKDIHNLVVSSAQSRFKKRWRGIAISFPRHKQDHMMAIAHQVEKGIIKDTFVSIKPTWVVRPDRSKDDFADHYIRDPEDADTKYGCNPPAAVDSFFRSPELLLLHAHGGPLDLLRQHLDLPEEELEAIARRGQCPITAMDIAGDPHLDRRGFPKLARWFRGQKSPGGLPYEYYVHLDPGLSGDSFGFAMGHNHQLGDGSLLPTLDIAFRWTGRMFKDFGEIWRQSWFEDTVSTSENISASEVDFRTVREFIFYLSKSRNFNIRQVSMDNWNSADSKQALERRGYQIVYRVVAKTDYDELKTLIYGRQLHYYAYPVLIEECLKLQIVNGTKVDAPRTKEGAGDCLDSHKDVADAAAAVCRYLSLFREAGVQLYEPGDGSPAPKEIAQDAKPSPELLEGLSDLQRSLLDRFF